MDRIKNRVFIKLWFFSKSVANIRMNIHTHTYGYRRSIWHKAQISVFFYLSPLFPLSTLEGVSQSGFDFVAAIFRLRKLLEFNKRFSQTEVCGYKKPNYDTVSLVERGIGSEVFRMSLSLTP
jgi:hypothetical protein